MPRASPHYQRHLQSGAGGGGPETLSLGNSSWQQLGEAPCVQLGGRESKDKRKPGRNPEGMRWISGGSDKAKRRETDKERTHQHTQGKEP